MRVTDRFHPQPNMKEKMAGWNAANLQPQGGVEGGGNDIDGWVIIVSALRVIPMGQYRPRVIFETDPHYAWQNEVTGSGEKLRDLSRTMLSSRTSSQLM